MEERGSREHEQPHRRGDFHKQKRYDYDSEYSLLQLQLHCSQPRSSFFSTHSLQNESNCDSASLWSLVFTFLQPNRGTCIRRMHDTIFLFLFLQKNNLFK
jgi:hypothetical protein